MRRFAVYFLLANLIGGFFLWLAARDLPLGEIGRYVQDADLGHLALWSSVFIVVYIVCHGSRVVRWLYLLRPLDDDLDRRTVYRVGTVGFTAILLLPLRLGELVRPYLLARRSELSLSGVLGTAVVERVVDGLLMTGLLFATLATYGGGRATAFARSAGYIAAAIFIPALLICILAIWRRDLALAIVRAVGEPIAPGLTRRAVELLENFIGGFRGLLEADNLVPYLGLTALYWSTNVVSLWLLARFGFGLEITPWQMATVLPILVIGIMIPAGPA
ncbi:MAG: lysylphosphatidylglycerol synthase transmembrane domain-containing protein, partial [Persicimonas sp.]